MRAVFMGTPAYARSVLEALLWLNFEVVGVYTQPDKPSGRGRVVEPPPIKRFALERGIKVFQPASLRSAEVQQALASLASDVIVVAAYGKILPSEVLRIPHYGCVNVHPSLLPRYRGPSPVATAILDGESHTGATILLMDEGMDSGPILLSRSVPIDHSVATTESLTQLLFDCGAELLKEAIPLWTGGEVMPQPQDHHRATFTKKLEKGDGEARWELSAQELERRLRAFTPWPGLFTYWKGGLLKILSAAVVDRAVGHRGVDVRELPASAEDNLSGQEPGLVVPLDGPDVVVGVGTGRGVLGLKRLQLEGRRPVSSREFLQGYREFLGSRLPS